MLKISNSKIIFGVSNISSIFTTILYHWVGQSSYNILRRFQLKSAEAGTITSSFDIGSLLLMIPVTYFGGKIGTNRPRYISLGMIIMAIGAFIWMIPHFATPAYKNEEIDGRGTGSLRQFFYVFVLAQLLIGSGSCPLETLGIAYIDDNVDSDTSPLYIAIFQTGIVLGPAAGFVLGGQLLNFHTDFISNIGITSSSSLLWVGAWWPGFIITSIGSLFCVIFLYNFPRTLKDEKKSERESKGNVTVLSEMMNELHHLITNLPYMLIAMSDAVDFLILSGLSSFLPKYMEHQYQMSTANAGQIVGLLVVIAGASGTILSGVFVKKFVHSTNGAITLCMAAHTLALPLWFIFLLSCPNLLYAGVSTSSNQSLSSSTLECKTNVSCSSTSLDPVCGSDGLMYLSPCLAGCQDYDQALSNFTQCSCISGNATAVRNICDNNCDYLLPFIGVLFVIIFLTFWINTPSTMALIRSVHEHQKSLALGLQRLLVGLFGGIPGPVLFGYFIDRNCILWNHGKFIALILVKLILVFSDESGHGSCIVYDNVNLSIFFCSICVVAKLMSLLLYLGSKVSLAKKDVEEIDMFDNPNFEHDNENN